MGPVRNVIFDLDGTLVDSLPGIAWSVEAAFLQCGLPWQSPDLKPLIGPPIRQILAHLSGISDSRALDHLEGAFRSSYDSDGWRRTLCHEGAGATLNQLRCLGISLWLVTNKPADATRMILRALAIIDSFEDILCHDSRIPAFGSKAEMVEDVLNRHNLFRATCLMVGDTMEDACAAAAAGIPWALVPHGYGIGLDGHILRGWGDLLQHCAAVDPLHVGIADKAIGEEI